MNPSPEQEGPTRDNHEELARTEAYLHEQIPLSRAMGVRLVGRPPEGGLILEAPLEPNRNHLQTAFGGSLNAIATLSAYAFLWLEIGRPGAHLVIRESSISFRRPVRGTLRAICKAPPPAEIERFRGEFAERGRARIDVEAVMEAVMEAEGAAAVHFRGTFVAIR